MSNPAIICVDDQREVLAAVIKDLAPFDSHCDMIGCESPDEAWGVIDDLDASGIPIAVIISDQVMPGTTGVDFLGAVAKDGRFALTGKLLLTGLATHEDTIAAINQARISGYIAKPWQSEALVARVREELTRYILSASDLRHEDFTPVLDSSLLLAAMRRRGGE